MRRPLPNLNLLVTFEAAARRLSFKLAAEQLHVTPSAVSQQIQQLEDNLGVSLFERHNRALSLTDAGEQYLNQIRPHLSGLRRATRALVAPRHSRLRVSVMPPVAARVVLPGMEAFRAQHPDVELEVETNLANVDMDSGSFDLAIRYGQPPWPGLSHEKLADVMVQVFTPVGFTERFGLQGDVQAMTQVPLVHMTGRPGAWQQWFDQLALPTPQGPEYYVDDYPAAVQAAETLGAALALYPVEYSLVQSGRVEAPFPPLGPLDSAIYAVYPDDTTLPEGGRLFIDWLRERLAQLPD